MTSFDLQLTLDVLGLHFIERGWLSANNSVFIGKRGPSAVVDTGYSTHAGQTLELVKHALDGRSLDLVLNTHLHSDHCGGNAALAAAYPLSTTWIPPGQWEAVQRWDPVALTYQPTGQECPRFLAHQRLIPGEEIQLGDWRWEIHGAPGHDPHSVVLYQPHQQCLISADALWENGFGVVFPELEGEEAFQEVAETLELIRTLEARIVIP
ncbi:MAG: MBL fold metallo-hydrolase, partial [Gammaproteobacteria bacterium]